MSTTAIRACYVLRTRSVLSKNPNRFWWLSLVFVAATTLGFHAFEKALFVRSDGLVGVIVGFALGAFLAALLKDYIEQNTK